MTKQQRLILLVSILASFVSFLDGFVVNVALPAISRELGGGLVVQQWVVNAYLITLGALMLLAGSLSDVLGRKKVLWLGLVGFGVASILCALAPSGLFLVGARGLQGVAGALLVPSSLALIISGFSGSAQGKAIGTWTGWTGIAAVIGPLVGGVIVDSASWRYIFAINIIPILVTLWLMRRIEVEEKKREVPLDIVGALLGALGLGGVVFGLIQQEQWGWRHPAVVSAVLGGVVLLVSFLAYERRTKHPMLPLGIFRIRNFSVGNVATVFVYAALGLSSFMITIFVQQVAGFSALEAGMMFLPVTVVMFFGSSLAGKWAGRVGSRWFMATGPLLMAAGFLSMLRATLPLNYWTEILPGVLLFAVGLCVTVAPLTSAVLGSISSKQAGIGSAVNNAVSRVATLVAVAAIGVITGPLVSLGAFQRGLVAIATLAALGGVVSAIGIRNTARETTQVTAG